MTNRLRLRALRLVGFHNYNDELIEVHGDLFVIGDNESGKTTILDALHLILSGAQSFDLNAAAKMTGRRDEGRSLQGIILRADLAGNPHPDRKGGSITYAVAEFEQDIGKPPVTLLFGASAVDMNARARKWGVLTSKHAADLPLVKEQEDGSFRIVDRDELALLLEDPILTDMGKYRTAVADRLFNTREDFDLVTDLWRKAKSYRELSKAARGFDELFRQVLPVPDSDPFDAYSNKLSQLEAKSQTLDEQIKTLQANKSYQAVTQLEELETRLKGIQRQIDTLSTRLSNAHDRLTKQTRDRDACIKAAKEKLSSATRRFDELGESLLDISVDIVEQLLATQRLLPNTVDDELRVAAIRTSIADTKRSAAQAVSEVSDLLDATAVRQSGIAQPKEGTSLLNFLHTDNQRIRAHLQATLGTLALLAQPAPDGADQHWFAIDGAGGERGARWQLELDAPRWIGEETRRRIREQEIERLRTAVDQLDDEAESVQDELARCHGVRDALSKLPSQLDELDLPGSIERLWDTLDQFKENIRETERQISEVDKDLVPKRREQEHFSTTISADLLLPLMDPADSAANITCQGCRMKLIAMAHQ